jgi:hypothetical protein
MDKRLRERPAGDLDRGSWRVTWNRRSVGIRAAEIALAVVTFTIGLVGAEMACRVIDGYELWSAHLVRIPTSPSPTSHAAAVAKVATEHAAQIPPAAGMKGEWFSLSPPPVSRRSTNPTFERIAKRYTASMLTFELFHVYNSSFIAQQMCKDYFRRFPGFFFVYDPPAGTEYPRYRFPLNEVTPYGLVTNQFGWRGPPIELRKAANTIRIAFVGASTSVNDHSFPYSYPEFAGFFLDSWAREVFGVRVEMINAGREGITSTDIAAVVRDEVLPLEPDLVVYYEGSNQFRPGSIIRLGEDPGPRSKPSAYIPDRDGGHLGQRFALARRFHKLLPDSGVEPSKPHYEVVWPPDVNEFDPPLNHKNLPASLSTVIHDLDAISDSVSKAGGELVVSSFFWLVYDGLKLDPYKHRYLHSHLNESYYPYRYREMERLATFQNRVLKKFAADRGALFIDVAGMMARAPDLFVDAIHATYDGVRLHAWIAAQLLAPLLRERIESGRLPRPFHSGLQTHPAFPSNERTLVFDCNPDIGEATTVTQLDLSKAIPDIGSAKIEAGSNLTVRILRNARRHLYAARIPVVAQEIRTYFDGVHNMQVRPKLRLQAQIKVMGGEARIGVLAQDEQTFLAYQTVAQTKGFATLDVPFWATSLGPVIIAAGSTHPSETVVELRDARIVSVPGYSLRGSLPGLSEPPQ